mgnify:FL=1
MEDNEKSGYSAEGRKLRPRRPRVSDRVYGSDNQNPTYDQGNNYSERRNYSPRNNYQDRQGGYGNSPRKNNYGDGGYGNSQGNYQPRPRRSYGDSSYQNDQPRRNNYGEGGYDDYQGNYQGNYQPRPRRSYGEGGYNNRGYNNDGGEGRSYGGGNRPQRRNNFQGGGQRNSYGGGYGQQRNAGGRGPGRPQKNNFKPKKKYDASQEGINRMLSRKPQVDELQYSDFDNAPTPIEEVVRLNKFIANSGVCSRREADQYIQAGVVTVNGEVVTELGSKVNVLTDEVKFNGETIRGEEKVYIVMNKPKGYVTTASHPPAEKTVIDLLKGCKSRVFPVGRLDKNTTGVLMFTNDGEIAEKLTHPSYDKKKIYQVSLDHPLSQEDYNTILSGVTLNDGEIKADELEYIDSEDHKKLGIEIHSGRNRIVRRIFEALGYEVKALDRVYFAGLTKKGLKKGEWRFLSKGEANVLKMGSYI